MKRKPREVVFLASIDYNYNEKDKGKRLRLSSLQSDNESGSLLTELKRTITSDLPADLHRIYGLSVETRVIDLQEGSILLFFSAAITAVGFFSNYADFFESIGLVKRHAQILLERVTRVRFGPECNVSVMEQYPSLPNPNELVPWRKMREMFGPEVYELWRSAPWFQSAGLGPSKRDGFFWFLLILNIVLLGVVGALVAAAVMKTYFSIESIQ